MGNPTRATSRRTWEARRERLDEYVDSGRAGCAGPGHGHGHGHAEPGLEQAEQRRQGQRAECAALRFAGFGGSAAAGAARWADRGVYAARVAPRLELSRVQPRDELIHAQWRNRWFLLGLLLVPLIFYRATLGEDGWRRCHTLAPWPRVGRSGVRVWLRIRPACCARSVSGSACWRWRGRVEQLRPQAADEGIDTSSCSTLRIHERRMANLPAESRRARAAESRAAEADAHRRCKR